MAAPPPVFDAAAAAALADALAAGLNRGHVAGGSRKPPKMTTRTPAAWRIFVKQFRNCAEINGWADLRARRELLACMEGDAAAVIQDIDIRTGQDGVAAPLLQNILDQYQARFITRADTDLAHVDFETAKQTDDESILDWHSRMAELFRLAFPGDPDVDGGNGRQLRQRFIMGLADPEVKAFCWDTPQPDTYAAALQKAQSKMSTKKMLTATEEAGAGRTTGRSTSSTASQGVRSISQGLSGYSAAEESEIMQAAISAIGGNQRFPGRCWICRVEGHVKADCPYITLTADYLDKKGMKSAAAAIRDHLRFLQSVRGAPGAGSPLPPTMRPAAGRNARGAPFASPNAGGPTARGRGPSSGFYKSPEMLGAGPGPNVRSLLAFADDAGIDDAGYEGVINAIASMRLRDQENDEEDDGAAAPSTGAEN